jgi:hypothetical protein
MATENPHGMSIVTGAQKSIGKTKTQENFARRLGDDAGGLKREEISPLPSPPPRSGLFGELSHHPGA